MNRSVTTAGQTPRTTDVVYGEDGYIISFARLSVDKFPDYNVSVVCVHNCATVGMDSLPSIRCV